MLTVISPKMRVRCGIYIALLLTFLHCVFRDTSEKYRIEIAERMSEINLGVTGG